MDPRPVAPAHATLFVPGRLCLFGEHSDWAGSLRSRDPDIAPGACIITGTDQGITATASASSDFEMTSHLPDGSVRGPFRVAMDGTALRHAATTAGFFSYAAGVAAELWDRCRPPGVCIAVDRMDLPVSRGLSSSAAVCVLTARAFNQDAVPCTRHAIAGSWKPRISSTALSTHFSARSRSPDRKSVV